MSEGENLKGKKESSEIKKINIYRETEENAIDMTADFMRIITLSCLYIYTFMQ